MENLAEKLTAAFKDALKSGDATRKTTISLVRGAVKNAEIEKRAPLSDAEILAVIEKEAKKRREAATEYDKANRPELAQKERDELAVLAEFLPEQMSEEELGALVQKVVSELGASGAKEMGRVMGVLRPQIAGKADGKLASELVKKALG